jgi:hypothetical protein
MVEAITAEGREMQAFLVRPIMTGLLALIIAGLWGVPQGRYSAGAVSFTACHADTAPAVGLAGRRGGRC